MFCNDFGPQSHSWLRQLVNLIVETRPNIFDVMNVQRSSSPDKLGEATLNNGSEILKKNTTCYFHTLWLCNTDLLEYQRNGGDSSYLA